METMHKVQVATLQALRRTPAARYSQLMRHSQLESDVFKFHLRRLVKQGLVTHREDGFYCLSPEGKEFANNLDEDRRTLLKQPKLSVIMIVPHPQQPDTFLFQGRQRHPYFDYWGLLSGPVLWGEDAEATAARELQKQTGLTATFVSHAMYRQKDVQAESGELLEDKLFIVLRATDVHGELDNSWPGGHNEWLTVEEVKAKGSFFVATDEMLRLAAGAFRTSEQQYSERDY